MADSIITLPALVTSVDTSEHEIQFPSYLTGADQLYIIEVVTGTIQLSADRSITSGSATFAQASNNKTLITIKGSLFYKATTIGDKFTISR